MTDVSSQHLMSRFETIVGDRRWLVLTGAGVSTERYEKVQGRRAARPGS